MNYVLKEVNTVSAIYNVNVIILVMGTGTDEA